MLSIETIDDWTLATLDVTIGVDTAMFTPTSAVHSAYAWGNEFTAWIADAGRPWVALGVTAQWGWRVSEVSPYLGRVDLGLLVSEAWSWVATAASEALTGIPSDAQIAGTWYYGNNVGPAAGCVVPHEPGYWRRGGVMAWSSDRGDGGSFGAVLPFAPGLTTAAPAVQGVLRPVETTWLAFCVRRARSPRRARLWDELSSTWRNLALGEDRRERKLDLTIVSLDVLTGAVP